jgi:hypothetical protein
MGKSGLLAAFPRAFPKTNRVLGNAHWFVLTTKNLPEGNREGIAKKHGFFKTDGGDSAILILTTTNLRFEGTPSRTEELSKHKFVFFRVVRG